MNYKVIISYRAEFRVEGVVLPIVIDETTSQTRQLRMHLLARPVNSVHYYKSVIENLCSGITMYNRSIVLALIKLS